jgi:ADP-glucose pyrophosphorylase
VVDRAVVLHDCIIRSGAHVERAILDTGVEVASGEMVRSDEPDQPAVRAGRGDDTA